MLLSHASITGDEFQVLGTVGSSDDEDAEDEEAVVSIKKKKHKSSVFASADDYEEQITKGQR